ncbi:NPCBM/NEW2 domain-containing protein, partial [Singulisphaera rosea]
PAPAQANPAPGAPNAQGGAPAQPPKPKEPKAKIPLDELASIQFERTPNLTARFVGQPNLDFTMPGLSAKKEDAKTKPGEKTDEPAKDGDKKQDAKEPEKKAGDKTDKKDAKEPEKKDGDNAEKKDIKEPEKKDGAEAKAKAEPAAKKAEAKPKKEGEKKPGAADDPLAPPPGTAAVAKIAKLEPKKNGIRDINLSLGNLRPVAIKQIMITCPTDGGPTSWRLDTTDSQDWPVVLRRSGTEGWADVFLEPPASDCHQKDFTVNVTYEDGQNGNANAKAEGHSDAKLAIDSKTPQTPTLDAWVVLSDDEKLFGKIEGMTEETLKLTSPAQEHLNIPLGRVVGIHFCLLDRKETPASFAKRLKSRGTEDVLLAQTKNGEVVAISGVVEKLENERLSILYQGKSRSLPIKQVEGLVMATKPEANTPSEPRPTFTMPGGVMISGKWKDLDTSVWKVETAWGQELKLPAGDVQEVKFRGGKVTYLSDLTPGKVEETPFFGRKFGWRKDVNLLGEPIKVDGQTYERGLAVHSRCVLTYDLNGQYSSFETTLGFDDAAKGKGRVDCRVLADGKEIYANPDLRADAPPLKLSLPVKGAAELKLLVDFGRGQDTGDRVIWANARLVRPTPAEPSATKSAAKADTSKTPENVTERR